jgi:cytochrome c553
MPKKLLILAVAVAYGIHMSGALSDVLAREKKAEACAICHRVDNSHGAPLLDGLPAGYLLKQFELYKSGKRFGPVMQVQLNALATQDLQDIAAYFSSRRSTRASTRIAVDQQVTQLGLTIANDLRCAECHGQEYRGTQDVPRLAGQPRNYLAFTIVRLQRDSSLHPPMASPGQLIPQPSVEALATYLASLEP